MFDKKKNAAESYGVIGLGRFGTALVKTLAAAGKEVIAVDKDEAKVKAVRGYTDYAFVIDELNETSLKETGMQNCGTVTICIGEQIDISILTTMLVTKLGVPHVISKAASEVHGEGIFIEFNESVIKSWEQNAHVADRDKTLFVGHQGWRNARHLKPDVGFPPSRYTMLHTIAHLLVRELALECGYNAASIRERVYASSDPEAPMAGILLYTAAADSDGTLGGLVDLGKPDFLGRLLDQALERASICSSDPLCSEHDPSKDRSLHAAACHSCTFVSETSCERGNRYLDRALVIPTLRDHQACLFHEGSA
mgnify:CR=1 FL=1